MIHPVVDSSSRVSTPHQPKQRSPHTSNALLPPPRQLRLPAAGSFPNVETSNDVAESTVDDMNDEQKYKQAVMEPESKLCACNSSSIMKELESLKGLLNSREHSDYQNFPALKMNDEHYNLSHAVSIIAGEALACNCSRTQHNHLILDRQHF